RRWGERVTERASRELSSQVNRALASLRSERGDIDQRLHVVITGGGVGDDDASVRMTNQHDRSRDTGQHTGDVFGATRRATQWVRGGDHRVALVQETWNDPVPAR